MLSNLHSFHFGALLQNSSALPWHVYQSTTNKLLLRPLKPTTTKPTATVTVTPRPKRKPTPHSSKHPAGKLQAKTQKKPGNSTPDPGLTSKTRGQKTAKWKPGPGVIEKVDKATGEIMHLSAE